MTNHKRTAFNNARNDLSLLRNTRTPECARAYLMGLDEAESDVTTHFVNLAQLDMYNRGRNLGRFLLGLDDKWGIDNPVALD